MKIRYRWTKLLAGILGVCLWSGCRSAPAEIANSAPPRPEAVNAPANDLRAVNTDGAATTPSAADRRGESKKDGHEHTAPHGGTLVAFGDEFAHLELVLDPASGTLTAYALDGEAEKSVALAQQMITVEVEKPRRLTIRLEAVENALTGEKRGATSEFRAASEDLKNFGEFDARIASITIRGREFKSVGFNFPHGNEGGHRH